MINEIIQGDIREVAEQLETGSVNCIVTSPPYWGLRDYGTAKWVGGDPACDHKPGNVSRVGASTLTGGKNHSGHLHEGYKEDCLRCGAKRIDQQIGLEPTPEEYVAGMVAVFRELWRVLRDDGTLWLNLGDSYASDNGVKSLGRNDADRNFTGGGGNKSGSGNPGKQGAIIASCSLPQKNLVGIPWRVALALQADGWILRSDIIWSKPNPMPESVTDRPTKAHEYIFLLVKSERYYYDAEAVKELATETNIGTPFTAGKQHKQCALGRDVGTLGTNYGNGIRNRRTVWTVAPQPYSGAHFATFPPDLIEPCILAGCPPGGVVLDPFFGSGTTGQVCVETGRNWLGVELNPKYIKLAKKRIAGAQPPLIVVGSTPPSNNPLQPNGYRCEQQPLFAVGESGNSGETRPPAIG